MAFIKKDVSDKDIEDLFDNNDNKAFRDNPEDTSFENELIPDEINVTKNSNSKIQRPDSYQADEVHQKKLNARKLLDSLEKSSSEETLMKVSGSVSSKVFNKIAELRKKAQLEEFISKQRKIPKIEPTARYKLYNDQPQCTFHVYQLLHMLDSNRFLCSCKFCSHEKIFTANQWKEYELDNRQYM